MPVNVVLDYPQRHRARRLRRFITTLVGGFLVFIGLTASIGAIPTFVYVVGIVMDEPKLVPTLLDPVAGTLDAFGIDVSAWPQSMPGANPELLLAAALSIAIMIVGLSVGLRLLRGNRKLVLFLRRFGYAAATSVVTFAAAKTIGRSWRLVTLDDAAVAPLGMPTGTSRLVRAAGLIRQGFMIAASGVIEMGKFSLGAPWIILGLVLVQSTILGSDLGHAFDPYVDVYASVMEGHIPFDAMRPTLLGAFAVAATLCAFTVLAMLVVLLASMVAIILSVPFTVLDFASAATHTAEKSKTRRVENAQEIDSVANALTAASRKVFAPRLVVLHVASEVWQKAVMRLAAVGSLTIIDVSEPTENLLWEIQELTQRFGPRCVFVGQSDRVAHLTVPSGTPNQGSLNERLLHLLDGREVLAYTADRRGMRRFAGALRAKLLELAA